ncbi:MAG: SusC/RagA family TonB-linked outer membrane protein [Pseudobacter sp.]|uniref:SusC/RagA family TonB-linked outer membrane protein n=1 Tax=Pseudobacter sp. TaxID=2045420 RepID=UPI003F80B2BD
MKKNLMRTGGSRHPLLNKGIRSLLSLLMMLACMSAGFAQNPIRVSGKVQSPTGLPLAGATVAVKGGAASTSTDSLGSFTITAPDNGTLEVTYVGYKKQEIPIAGKTVLLVSMETTDDGLGEVIVVGYNTQRRKAVTGAVGTVNMGDVEARRVPDVSQVLQGQVAGVQVTQSTGAPGDEISIRIRGEGTIGNNSPLFVVDGVPSRDITFLNPSDIESMTVLKDASAAAMYGSRGSAGVVLITTRSGRKGRTVIDLNYFAGVQQATNLPKMLNGQQYMNKMEETWNNSGNSGTNPYTTDKGRTDLANTDWLKETFETGFSQNLQLTASGGSDKVQFLLSGGYYKQDGIVVYDHDQFKRISFRANINANLTDRLTVGTNIQMVNTAQDRLSSKGDAPGIIRHAMIRPPVIPVRKDPSDPTWSARDPFTDLPFYQSPTNFQDVLYERTSNPVAISYFTNDKRSRFKTFGNVFGEYAFLREKELKFRTNLGVDLNFIHNKAFNPNYGDDDGGGNGGDRGQGRKNRPNSLTDDRGEEMNFTWTNTLSYSKRFNKHQLNTLVGSEYITWRTSNTGGSRMRFDYDSPNFQYLDYGGTSADIWNGGSASDLGLFSLFGTVTYSYASKYFLTANFRADASSRFGENNRWGYYPSASIGWRISEEDFMRDISWLDDLRLRASVGSLGNQELPYYVYKTLYKQEGEQYKIKRYGNPDLKWETTTQTNFGVDLAMLRNKLTLSVDYFVKRTSDILLPIALPEIVGSVDPTYVNAGEVTNKGIELALGYKNTAGEFKYGINANFAAITNNVEKLHPNLPAITGTVFRSVAGRPLSSFYGYNMEGIYQNQAEIDKHLFGAPHTNIRPGYIKFEDRNGDGIINDADRTFIGNPNPKYTYGLNLTGSFRGFDLNILFQGVQDVDKYNDLKKITDYDTRPFNHSTATLGSWHGEGTSNTIPISTFKDNGSSRVSSIFIEDASYLRLKNVELGYSFRNALKRVAPGIQNLRVYISAQNLFTITNYTGLDPESTDMVDMGTYPLSRAILFGLNLTF